MSAVFLATAFLIFIVTIYFLYLREFLRNRKRTIELAEKFAGLPAYPIVGNALQFSLKTHGNKLLPLIYPMHFSEFYKQYMQLVLGAIDQGANLARYWIGNQVYVIPLNGETLKPLLESNTELVKGSDYDFYRQFAGNGLVFSNGDYWRSRRKMLTPTFHFAILTDFVRVFNQETKILIDELTKAIQLNNDSTVDLFPYLKRFTLDLVCETAMGHKMNAQRNHNSDYVRSIENFSQYAVQHAFRYFFYQFRLLWYTFGSGFKTDQAVKTTKQFTHDVIKNRMLERKNNPEEETKKRPAFLDLLLSKQDENRLTFEDIEEEVQTFVFAGHDTTSASIGWTLWCLAHNPTIQTEVQGEIDTIMMGSHDRDLTIEDLSQFPILERCIKESMRMFPPAPYLQRTLQSDLEMGEQIVPKGSNVCIAPLPLHYNKNIWPEPFVFNPDNFLPEAIEKRTPHDYIPFSAGARNCIGQKFAIYEEKVALAHLLTKFRFEVDSSDLFSNQPCFEAIMKPYSGFPMRLIPRKGA